MECCWCSYLCKIEQRYAIKFSVKLNKSATETFVSLTEAYGDATLSRTMVFKWHRPFKGGRENVEDDPRSGSPISSTNDQNVEVVWVVMAKDRWLSVGMIVEETGEDKNAVHRILTDHLHMWKICAKLVLKILSVEQKANWLEICQDLLGKLKIEPNCLDKVITGDESWVFDYNPETKQQSEEWHMKSSRPKKACMSRSRVKTMIIVFFDSHGIVHNEFVPPGKTVNHAFYKISWNDFENGSSESKRTLQTIGCCTTIMHQLTLRLQLENFWWRKTFPYFHILPTAQI